MSLLRDSGGTRPARGPLVGTALSILFHVLVLIAVLTLAPRLRLLVSLDTVAPRADDPFRDVIADGKILHWTASLAARRLGVWEGLGPQ
jgi:hypothetical protein